MNITRSLSLLTVSTLLSLIPASAVRGQFYDGTTIEDLRTPNALEERQRVNNHGLESSLEGEQERKRTQTPEQRYQDALYDAYSDIYYVPDNLIDRCNDPSLDDNQIQVSSTEQEQIRNAVEATLLLNKLIQSNPRSIEARVYRLIAVVNLSQVPECLSYVMRHYYSPQHREERDALRFFGYGGAPAFAENGLSGDGAFYNIENEVHYIFELAQGARDAQILPIVTYVTGRYFYNLYRWDDPTPNSYHYTTSAHQLAVYFYNYSLLPENSQYIDDTLRASIYRDLGHTYYDLYVKNQVGGYQMQVEYTMKDYEVLGRRTDSGEFLAGLQQLRQSFVNQAQGSDTFMGISPEGLYTLSRAYLKEAQQLNPQDSFSVLVLQKLNEIAQYSPYYQP